MKWMGWLSKMVFAAVLVSGVSVATTWLMINAYVQQFVAGFTTGTPLRPVSLSELFAPQKESETAVPSVNTSSEEGPNSLDSVATEALPVMGGLQSSQQADEILFSAEELGHKKDQLTDKDRTDIFTILASNVPADQLQHLSVLMEDGFTTEEMREAADVLQAYLSEEQYTQLIDIFSKY